MTDDELRIKVAELLGYRLGALAKTGYTGMAWFDRDGNTVFLPDYPNDLNAMHEAEVQLMTTEHWPTYIESLKHFCPMFIHRATARQRAEAFVATLTK